jgi:hypothetical protein
MNDPLQFKNLSKETKEVYIDRCAELRVKFRGYQKRNY